MFSLKTPFIYDFQGNGGGGYVVETEATLGDFRLHLAPLQGHCKLYKRIRSNLNKIAGPTLSPRSKKINLVTLLEIKNIFILQ